MPFLDPTTLKTEDHPDTAPSAIAATRKPNMKSRAKKPKLALKPKLIPVSSRTKRALGLPGRSIRVRVRSGRRDGPASRLLSILVELQARSRSRKFQYGEPVQNAHADDDVVLLDPTLFVHKTQHPPRAVPYDRAGLKAFNEVKWAEAAGARRKKAEVDACWELSAIPWLAATANGNGNGGMLLRSVCSLSLHSV